MKKLLLLVLLATGLDNIAQVDLVSNLKVCMPFNGNATDVSGNANNGTVSSVTLTTDSFGNANKAYQFDRNQNSFISSFLLQLPDVRHLAKLYSPADLMDK